MVCIYSAIIIMLVRICFLVCAAILLASANPVPQDSVEPVLPLGNEPIENVTELPESNSDAVESGTEDPDNSDGNDGTKTQTEIEGTEEILGTQDTPSKSEDVSGTKSDGDDESVTSSDVDESFDDENEPQPESDVSGDGSEEPKDESESDGSNEEENKSDLDNNENDNNIEHDEKSGNDEPSSEDGYYGESDQEYEQDLSIIKVDGVLLRTYRILKGDEEIVCQEFKSSGRRLDKQCFNSPRLFHHSTENIVSVHNKYINGHNFICQEIVNFVRGPLQVLCATEYQYFYEKSPIIDD